MASLIPNDRRFENQERYSDSSTSTPESTQEPAPPTTKKIGEYVTKDGFYASTDPEQVEKMLTYAVQKDIGAMQKALNTGAVTELKPGVPVRIVDHKGFFATTVKVRVIGDTTEFWTMSDALVPQ